ncbi:MAG: delta-60 repeat domain-containing protein [Acidobacteria bacterium]|nr:delta-60 repeat domain-containing protein [Acidobacteriota bacterium]
MLDTTFDTGSPGLDNSVNEIVVQPDGKILIGGMFLYLNGVRAGQIARLNADGSRDWGFNPGGMGTTGPDNMFRFVHSIALQPDGKILFGGVFEGYNNVPRFNFGRLNSDGTLDLGFRADINSTVAGIRRAPADGSYLITGTISSYDGVTQNNVLRLDHGNVLLRYGFQRWKGPNSSVVEPGFEPDGAIILGEYFQLSTDRIILVLLGSMSPGSLCIDRCHSILTVTVVRIFPYIGRQPVNGGSI